MLMVTDAEKIILSHPLILHTSHQFLTILINIQTQHTTAQRHSGYKAILCTTQNLIIQPISSPNSPANFFLQRLLSSDHPISTPFEDHGCLALINETSSIRSDLSPSPFEHGIHVYVDGSC